MQPLFVLLAISSLFAGGRENAQKKPYNVLFIAMDDMNDWMSAWGGYPGIKTPNVERLAKTGTIFTKAYCAAPACNPSRTSLLTGIRPSTSGVYHNNQPWKPVLPHAVTLPRYFAQNGYKVMGAGKLFHIPYHDPESWSVYYPVPKSPEPALKPVNGKDNFDWAPLEAGDEEMGDFKVVQKGIDFLNEPHGSPFFLAIGLYRPHLPWYVPQRYFDEYPLSGIVLPRVLEDDLDDIPGPGVKIARTRDDHPFILKTNQWKNAVQGYAASITFADAQLGRLLDALENSDYKDNTIIVFFGDHGWHLGEKEHWRKFSLWEESTRVPLVIVSPGLTKGNTVCERTVNLLDLYPTLTELCGLPRLAQLEGNSLTPLLKNPLSSWGFPSVSTHGRNNHAIRTERWRYIRYRDGSEELYDHDRDPEEWHNLAGIKRFDKVKKRLSRWLPAKNAPDAPAEGRQE